MSIPEAELNPVVEANTNALTGSLDNGFLDAIGNTENQAYKIFKHLDNYRGSDAAPGEHQQAVDEYREHFDRYNKAGDSDKLPEIQLVDLDDDGDMDMRIMKGGVEDRTYTNKSKIK